VTVSTSSGGHALREAKAFVTSPWRWAHEETADQSSSPDPFLETRDDFIYRRIAADSRKIELGKDAGRRLHRALLASMGFDLGAIHATHSRRVDAIENDLKKRPPDWLEVASDAAAIKVKGDYKSWRKSYKASREP
jgi:hypothetical protein